jgi:DNA-binding CsgD family transcriptional regulator
MKIIDAESYIGTKIAEIHAVADDFPGIIIIHNVQEEFRRVEYMSPRGLDILRITMEELHAIGEDYFPRYFNMEDANDYLPKFLELMQQSDTDRIYSFFQQVRRSPSEPWHWYSSSVKILAKDQQGRSLLSITFAVPINPLDHLYHKTQRLLEENNFLRRHFKEFSSLTSRETEVARALVSGLSATQIAQKLYVTIETVKTHRKNIYRKLGISSSHQLQEYARAFDLI